jgi:hypothetical protein
MKTKIFITILFLLTIFCSGNALAQCIQDPVGYWTLDQDTSPYLNEMMPNVDDGTCTAPGCPTVDTSGHVGSSQIFDGTDDGITIADTGTAIFDRGTADSFSIAVWFRREASATWAGNEVLVGRYAFNQTHFWVGLEGSSGHAYFRLWDNNIFGDYGTGFISGSTDLADGQWHHIVAVRNGQTNQNLLYVDGAEIGSIPITYTGTFIADAPMTIGRMNDNYYFIGNIDEVAYFDDALTADIVAQLFNEGEGRPVCTDNLPPQITSTAPTAATVGVEYVYAPTAEDPNDGDVLTWSFLNQQAVPDGMVLDPATGAITWTPSAEMTTDVITLVVADESGATASEDITITVGADRPADPPPSDDGGDSGGGGGCFITAIMQ